ncbi:MAG TPA: fibronectin type III domain-containing protein [Verrucomicrobiae bacterium]
MNSVNRRAGRTPRSFVITALLAACLGAASNVSAATGSVTVGWDPNGNLHLSGYQLYYGTASGVYKSNVNTGFNLSATIPGLKQGSNYYFAVKCSTSNGFVSAYSGELEARVPVPPAITTQPLAVKAGVGQTVTFSVATSGDAASYQWFNGSLPLSGATASTLKIVTASAGSYSVVAANPGGSVTSRVAALSIVIPPVISKQPQSLAVVATTAAGLSATVTGTAPVFQWYCGGAPLPGATNTTLNWASVSQANAGA